MSKPPFYVGLDVGGTTMKAGVVDESGQSLSAVSLPTEASKGQEFGLERMCETIRQAVSLAGLRLDQIAAIGVATPGLMDIPAGIILDPPNLRPWKNVPVRQHVYDTFKIPTAFQNDANAAALGEYWIGVGRDAHSMVLFTLGTGVGGGIIIGDWVLQGEHSHGAEIGHIIIETTSPRLCPCGRKGCLEAYASATAVVKRAVEAMASDNQRSLLHDILKQNGELTAKDVFDAAKDDALAERIVGDTAFYLAVGAVSLIHTINPDAVVFGGGMIAAGPDFLEQIRFHVKEMAFPVPAERTKILYAGLGPDSGYIGAAACGRLLLLRPEGRQPR